MQIIIIFANSIYISISSDNLFAKESWESLGPIRMGDDFAILFPFDAFFAKVQNIIIKLIVFFAFVAPPLENDIGALVTCSAYSNRSICRSCKLSENQRQMENSSWK